MQERSFSIFIVTALVAVMLCAALGLGNGAMGHGPEHSSSVSMQCCSIVSSGFVLEHTQDAPVFFAVTFLVLFFALFVPPKVTTLFYHPPKR